MVRQLHRAGALAGLLVHSALAAAPTVSREQRSDFEIDEAFQADGGVQLFFELIDASAVAKRRDAVAPFLALDRDDRRGALNEPVHVTVARLSYVVEKDVSFFTAERLLDVAYMQALAPELDITAAPDGGFRVGRVPSNSLSIELTNDPSLAKLVAPLARGTVVVVQENRDFARVMGWRTAAWSSTWTFHEPLGADRTRVTALSLTWLYNLPPPFLGGGQRLFSDTRDQALSLIARLRAYPASAR